MSVASHYLVIGYGNTLRHDDGVGVQVAEAVAGLNLPGVDVIARQQLTPELAASISKADTVIFVDADSTASQTEFRPIEPVSAGQMLAHVTNPRTLLALSKELFGSSPKACWLAVPVEDFTFGFGLSARSERGLLTAVKLIRNLVTGLTKVA